MVRNDLLNFPKNISDDWLFNIFYNFLHANIFDTHLNDVFNFINDLHNFFYLTFKRNDLLDNAFYWHRYFNRHNCWLFDFNNLLNLKDGWDDFVNSQILRYFNTNWNDSSTDLLDDLNLLNNLFNRHYLLN